MKKFNRLLVVCFVMLSFIITSSCEPIDECDGSKGTLKLTNDSHNTVQRIMIDGVNYGTLDPDEFKEIELAPGKHDWQLVGISGGNGCSGASVIIVACETSGFSCDGK